MALSKTDKQIINKLNKAFEKTYLQLNFDESDLAWYTDLNNEKFYVWRAKYRDSQMTWTYNKETDNVTFTWTHKD